MATILEAKPSPTAKYDARVRGELGKATSRIRANDALTGAAALAVLTLAYAVVGVLLDQWLDLPRPARQLGFAGFLTAFAAVAYFRVIRPLRRAVNPRFAARRIEATSPGAKNAVINWVDLQDRSLPDGVRAAIAVKAADGLADADVIKATESRPLMWLGTTAGLLVATLAVLLILCKPAQFFSLLGRTFNPFTTARIASRTSIALTTPATGDVTVTAGEPLTVAVGIGGRLPDPDGPTRVRLQFKHNPDATEYDELSLAPTAENSRDFSLRVPDYVVQNGFWYRVAAGDAVTADYRVTVRNRPLFKSFAAKYEYPAYLRMKPDIGRGPALDAYRGTVVTLTAKTNREVKSGRLRVAGKPDAVIGKVVGDGKDSLEFRFPLTESGSYTLAFTSAADEPSDPSPAYPITVTADRPPVVELTTPKEPESTLPANGLLAVDGTIGDDFGIDRVALHARVIPAPNDAPVVLTPKPYRDRSFRRETDDSFPTSVEYKDSLSLDKLNDSEGRPVTVKEGSVVEFWLEVTDNCTEPAANKGKSPVYRVTLAKKVEAPAPNAQQQKDAADRRREEQQFQKQQDQKLDAERREPPQPPKRADADQPQQQTDGQPGDEGQPGAGQQAGDKPKPDGTEGDPKAGGTPQENPQGPAKDQPGATADPKAGGKPAPNGVKPNDADLKEQADRVQQALNEQKGDKSGDGKKPDGQPSADAKPEPSGKPGDGKPMPGEPSAKPTGADDTKPEPGSAKPDAGQPMSQPGADPKSGQPKPGEAPKPQPAQPDGTGEKPTPDGNPPSDPSQPGQPGGPSGPGQPGDGKPQPGQQSGKQPEPGELDRLLEKNGQKVAPPKETVERLTRDANDLASPDQLKREQAEKKFDDQLGKKDRERLQQATKDQQLGGDPAKQEKAKEDVDELTKKAAKKERAKDLARQAGDLASKDDAKREAAEQKFDQELGEQGRKDLQDAMKDMKSGDPAQQKAGADKIKDMAQKAGGQPGDGKQPTPEQMKDLADAAKDLNSPDDAKRKAAEQKLDQQLGKDAREEAQQTAKNLQSSDPAKRQAAEDKLKDMAKKAGGEKSNPGEKSPGGLDAEQAVKDAERLASDDPKTRQAAEEKFDQKIGEQKRKELQQAEKDAKSGAGTPDERKAAKEKADQLAKDATEKPPVSDASQKRLAEAANDLASPDDAKRKAAEEKFDKAMGKDGREKLQQDVKDAKSGDPAKQQAAAERVQKQLDEQAKQGKGQPDPKDQQPSKDDLAKLAEKAKDLSSDDPAKREAAEKELDQKVGKETREQMQQAIKDMASGDPKKAEEGKRKLEDMAREAANRKPGDDFRPGGEAAAGRGGPDAKPVEGDVRDRIKTAELQLQQLEKARYNDEVKKKLGFGEKEYDAFVKSYQEMVERMKAKADDAAKGPNTPPTPVGPPVTRVGESGVAGFLPSDPATGPTAAGSGTAPPGFADAQRRFAEEAAKRGRK